MFIDENGYKLSNELNNLKPIYANYKEFCIEDGFRLVSYKTFRQRLDKKYQVKRTTVSGISSYYSYIQKDNNNSF
jgi:putative DNA primase/helicase